MPVTGPSAPARGPRTSVEKTASAKRFWLPALIGSAPEREMPMMYVPIESGPNALPGREGGLETGATRGVIIQIDRIPVRREQVKHRIEGRSAHRRGGERGGIRDRDVKEIAVTQAEDAPCDRGQRVSGSGAGALSGPEAGAGVPSFVIRLRLQSTCRQDGQSERGKRSRKSREFDHRMFYLQMVSNGPAHSAMDRQPVESAHCEKRQSTAKRDKIRDFFGHRGKTPGRADSVGPPKAKRQAGEPACRLLIF